MGKLYLIPCTLGDNDPREVIPEGTLSLLQQIHTFVVEEVRSARRFLSRAGLKGHIDELEFHVLNEHSAQKDAEALVPLFEKDDVGLISEAGLPAVADPGSALVSLCHKKGITVVPLTGPSSLMLALMASGLNGQSFAFCGYLPAKTEERRSALKNEERLSSSLKQSRIFIETPYRNDQLLSDMVQYLSPHTELCVAADLTLPSQFTKTLDISSWRRMVESGFTVGKRPCVFIILGK